ncbi:MAG: hypothetical protein LIP23_05405 [Planctomycetes bacterium]|nr:hypothetical protein [Planctomycetota bacterium]
MKVEKMEPAGGASERALPSSLGGGADSGGPTRSATPFERETLRRLAEKKRQIGELPVQKQTAQLWSNLNSLKPGRPLVWMNEIPWHEMNVDDELTCVCEDPFLKAMEWNLRSELYQWEHMRCDMVVDPVVLVRYVCGPTSTYADFGMDEKYNDYDHSSEAELGRNPIGESAIHGSVNYVNSITSEADLEKMHTPVVWFDKEETQRRYDVMAEVLDGVIPVRTIGIEHQWFSPWDQMIHWYGIEQLYLDMYDNPDLVHALLKKYVACMHEVLDKQEAMGLLAAGNGNHRVGSGGLGITDQLPAPGCVPDHARPIDQWGTGTGQIFSEVSPDMHEEFCLQYERPFMARFGLNCYGCCEPLHNKIALMRTIPRLRRISMSPWINLEKAVSEVGADFVFSSKPSPAVFAPDNFQREQAKKNLTDVMDMGKGCRIEFIMKDVTTVRNDPRRLWEWAEMAMQIVGA